MSLLNEKVHMYATHNFIQMYHEKVQCKPSILNFFIEWNSLQISKSRLIKKYHKSWLLQHWFFMSLPNENVHMYATHNFLQIYHEKVQCKPSILNFFIQWDGFSWKKRLKLVGGMKSFQLNENCSSGRSQWRHRGPTKLTNSDQSFKLFESVIYKCS